MWKNLGRETDRNTLHPLRQQQGELYRQRHRLFVSPVVGELPLRGFRIEDGLQGELREASLDVTRGSCPIADQDVTPVTLAVNQELLLSQLHQRIPNGGIAMRVKLHGMSHDVRHLVVASIVEAAHRVQDASLHRFQSIVDVRNGTLQDHVRGIVEEPMLVHARQVIDHLGIPLCGCFIVGMPCLLWCLGVLFLLRREILLLLLFVIIVFSIFRSHTAGCVIGR